MVFEKVKQYKILEKWIYIAGICGLLICELLKIVYTIRNNMTIEAKLNVFNMLGFILSVVGTIGLIGMWYSLYPNILKNFTCKKKVPEENTIAMLKECKKLLDEGIITKEEFEIQKAELLK